MGVLTKLRTILLSPLIFLVVLTTGCSKKERFAFDFSHETNSLVVVDGNLASEFKLKDKSSLKPYNKFLLTKSYRFPIQIQYLNASDPKFAWIGVGTSQNATDCDLLISGTDFPPKLIRKNSIKFAQHGTQMYVVRNNVGSFEDCGQTFAIELIDIPTTEKESTIWRSETYCWEVASIHFARRDGTPVITYDSVPEELYLIREKSPEKMHLSLTPAKGTLKRNLILLYTSTTIDLTQDLEHLALSRCDESHVQHVVWKIDTGEVVYESFEPIATGLRPSCEVLDETVVFTNGQKLAVVNLKDRKVTRFEVNTHAPVAFLLSLESNNAVVIESDEIELGFRGVYRREFTRIASVSTLENKPD